MNARKMLTILLAVCFLLTVTGCGSVFSAEYYYSVPFRESNVPENGGEAEVKNQTELKNAILELVEQGESEKQFRFGSYEGPLLDDLAAVCHDIKTSTPIGAYAVKDISYDTSRIVSYYTATVRIEYKISREEIAAVESVSGLGQLERHILSAMDSYAPETVIEIYSSTASNEYISERIADNYYADPLLVARLPEFEVESYPDNGLRRIFRIEFEYSAPVERLREMDEALKEGVSRMAESVRGDSPLARALSCAMILGEFCRENEEPAVWAETAYGCIVEGSENPKAMAMAYKALCDELEIPCVVVRGQRRGALTEEHTWNIIEIDGEYYHVDPSRIVDEPRSAFLLSDDDIWGSYDWNREKYPTCRGSLGPENVFGANYVEKDNTPSPEDEPLESPEVELPEQTPPPEESPGVPEEENEEE